MSLFGVFDIAGSGMSAQSVRLNTTASNIANAQSVSSSVDETYRARHPVFSALMDDEFERDFSEGGVFGAQGGVSVLGIVEDKSPLQMRYEPHHPMANEEGYVAYPNVNVVEEMTNMISSSRSFQVNVEVMNTAKTMMQRVLSLGQ
ncbi:MAG: flagellar basal body rod protein FlgC [Pseudomonadales bacterium]|nr:flagellar basal body rod protein FlgC [Pseudomonadales bacterium]